jgi:hypothetical protein
MVRTFESWALPIPPVPISLRPMLRLRGPKCWATRDIVGNEMYSWSMNEADEVIGGRPATYLAVSHAGHGVNSYAITYHLVYRGLALFVQEAWGGGYLDNEVQAAKLTDIFDRCAGLIDKCERQRSAQEPSRWLLCLDSRLRGTSACGWIPAGGTGDDPEAGRVEPAIVAADGRVSAGRPGGNTPRQQFLRHHNIDHGTALAHAESLFGPGR